MYFEDVTGNQMSGSLISCVPGKKSYFLTKPTVQNSHIVVVSG